LVTQGTVRNLYPVLGNLKQGIFGCKAEEILPKLLIALALKCSPGFLSYLFLLSALGWSFLWELKVFVPVKLVNGISLLEEYVCKDFLSFLMLAVPV